MTQSFVDIIAPDTIGSNLIVLSLSTDTPVAREGQACLIDVDYSACDPAGASLPLVLTFTGPDGIRLVHRVFTRAKPRTFEVEPIQGGPHLVRIGEMFHNRSWGSLVLTVEGGDTA
jgi:hypothetical protein